MAGSKIFDTSDTVQALRERFGHDGVDRSISVMDEGSMTLLTVRFTPKGKFLASDTPAHAIEVYGPRAGPLLANGYTGGGLLSYPHVLPYVEDVAIPWRLSEGAFSEPFVYTETENTLKDPMSMVRQMFELRRKAPGRNNHLVMLRGAQKRRGGAVQLTFGVGTYTSKRDSQESDGEKIKLTFAQREQQERENPDNFLRIIELQDRLLRRYPGANRVRDIVVERFGGLAPWSGAYNFAVGVACCVVTEDNFFPISVRRAGPVSVNAGLNVPSSGGVEAALWSEKWHLPGRKLLEIAMRNEIRRELGLPDGSYTLKLAGFLRELTRGGSPEFFFTVFFHGTLDQFLQYVDENTDEERKELSDEMKIASLSEVLAHFQFGVELGGLFHHKLLAAIAASQPHLEAWVRRK